MKEIEEEYLLKEKRKRWLEKGKRKREKEEEKDEKNLKGRTKRIWGWSREVREKKKEKK